MLATSLTARCHGNFYCQFFTDKGLESETGFLSEVRQYVCRIVGELPGSALSPLLFNWGPGRPHIPLVRQEVVVVVVEDVVEVVLEIVLRDSTTSCSSGGRRRGRILEIAEKVA